MSSQTQELRAELKQLSSLFSEEETVFRRSVIVFNFVETIFKNKEAKKAFDFLIIEASKEMSLADNGDREAISKAHFSYNCHFWHYFSNLDIVHSAMLQMKQKKDNLMLNKLDKFLCLPHSTNIFKIAFQVVSDCILEKMAQAEFFRNITPKNKTWFDAKNSILYVKGEKVLINRQGKITNAHKILHHIFIRNKKNTKDDFFYSEIAFDEFEDMEYKQEKDSWRKYFIACREINLKIEKETQNKIKDFLIFNYGKMGQIKINECYI